MYIIYGGIYYSVLLGKKKVNENEGAFKYIYSVVAAFVSSLLMAILVQASGGDVSGLVIGLIIGLLISLVYYKNALFGLMTKKSCLIAIGDHFVIFTLLGLLHGILN
jgi:membrane protease YdiL (CAAX protease family)